MCRATDKTRLGDRLFAVACPRLWNMLPGSLRFWMTLHALSVFWRQICLVEAAALSDYSFVLSAVYLMRQPYHRSARDVKFYGVVIYRPKQDGPATDCQNGYLQNRENSQNRFMYRTGPSSLAKNGYLRDCSTVLSMSIKPAFCGTVTRRSLCNICCLPPV